MPPPERLAAMARYLSESIDVVDRDGTLRWHLGPPDGVLGRGISGGWAVANAHPDDQALLRAFTATMRDSASGWSGNVRVRLHHVDGSWRTYVIEVGNHLDDGDLDGIVIRTREVPRTPADADDMGHADDVIAESIAEAVPVALVVLDRHGRIEFTNEAARLICDFPEGPTHGRYFPDVAVETDRPAVLRAVSELLTHRGNRTVVFCTRGWQGRGALRLIEARLLARGVADRPSTIIVILDDVTERRREEEELRRRASRDALTGVLNRGAVLEEMEARLASGPLTVIYCDLDGFKKVNDTYGHAGGDDLLKRVAKLLSTMARSSDVIGRLGGDEFVIVCEGLSPPHTASLLERLGDVFEVDLGVRISVGVAASEAGSDAASLLRRADEAMYDNKRRLRRRAHDESLP